MPSAVPASPYPQQQLHELNLASKNLFQKTTTFRSRRFTSTNVDKSSSPSQERHNQIEIEPRSRSVFRNAPVTITDVKQQEMAKRGKSLIQRGNAAKKQNLSVNMWDSMHQRKLSKSTLRDLPGVKVSPRVEKLPEVTPKLKQATIRLERKIQQSVPKGQSNYGNTISFLERIIKNTEGEKAMHVAFGRKKNSMYV